MTRGLTLIELVVVLAILATLSLVAIEAAESKLLEARYEASNTTIEAVRDAVVGQPGLRQTDGTPIVTGFVADMGRLPRSIAAGGTTQGSLRELQDRALFAGFPRGVYRPDEDNALPPDGVELLCGWGGPYLQLPLGQIEPVDGWGRPLRSAAGVASTRLLRAPVAPEVDPQPILDGQVLGIAGLRNLGFDGVAGGAVFDADQALTWSEQSFADVRVAAVAGQDPGQDLFFVVRVYQPDPEDLSDRVATLPSPTITVLAAAWDQPVNATVTGATVGVRGLRAYAYTDAGLTTLWGKSQVVYPVLVPGQNVLAQLTIRP